eukprot:8185678-Heterocapsa_arctica.AAC.1
MPRMILESGTSPSQDQRLGVANVLTQDVREGLQVRPERRDLQLLAVCDDVYLPFVMHTAGRDRGEVTRIT